MFAGFLPPRSGPRRSRLEELKSAPATLLFFETGPRLGKSLADLAGVLGPREAAIAKELAKLHESVTRGRLDGLAGEFSEGRIAERRVRGGGGAAGGRCHRPSDEIILEQLEKALKLDSFRDAVRSVAEVLNVGRARVYELGLKLKRD